MKPRVLLKSSILFVLLTGALSVFAASTVITTDTTEDKRTVSAGDTLTIDGATFTGNIDVDGGSLILQNSAKVVGDVTVSNLGNLSTSTSSTITNSVRIVSGDNIELRNSTFEGSLRVLKANSVTFASSTVSGLFSVESTTTVKSSGSTFKGQARVLKSQSVEINTANIAEEMRVQESNIVVVAGNTVTGNLRIMENTEVSIASTNNISKSLNASGNKIVLITSNTIGESLNVVDNIETFIFNNQVTNHLKIIPGGTVCDESGNVFGGQLKGGCTP